MYDLGLVLMGRSLDLLVAGPASLAGLGECGRKTGWAAAAVAVARGASEKEPPVSGVPGVPGAVSIPKEARRLALVLLVYCHFRTWRSLWEQRLWGPWE